MSNSIALPNPLTPADCDLRDFEFMPLDVVRLRDSDLASLVTGEEFRAAVLLWCASWHQVPAASLPMDDMVLAKLAGYGRVVKEWQAVREGALRGWIQCSDGRLYHPVVAEKACSSWRAKLEQRWKTECARIKKLNQRGQRQLAVPTLEQFLAGVSLTELPADMAKAGQLSLGTTTNVPEDIAAVSLRTNANVPRDSQAKAGDIPKDNVDCPQGNAIQGTGIGRVKDLVVNTEETERSSRLRDSARDPAGPISDSGQPGLAVLTGVDGADSPPRHVAIAIRLRSLGLVRIHASQAELLSWARDGVTDAELDAALQAALGQGKQPAQIVPKYLDTTLRNLRDRKQKPPAFAHNDFESQDYAGSALRVGARRLADGTYEL